MRRIISVLSLVLLLLSSSAWATWTCVDGATGCTVTTNRTCSTSGASCTITVASTTAGAVGTVCAFMSSATILLSSVTGAGTWTVPSASHIGAHSVGAQCAYNLNMTGGVTSIVCNMSGSIGTTCAYFAFTGTASPTFDTASTIDDSVNCTTCSGVALTLGTANNYILIQGALCGQTCSAINQSYTGFFPVGDGMAFKINVSSAGTTPSWTQSPSGILDGTAIAIYEASSATPTGVAIIE